MIESHPDDFMVVTVEIEFRAKTNPDSQDPPPVDVCHYQYTMSADAAPDELNEIITAIEERRLFGWVMQKQAEVVVSSGEWVENLEYMEEHK